MKFPQQTDKKMPIWLSITFKIIITLCAIVLYVMIWENFKHFRREVCSKTTMTVLYISISLSLFMMTIYTWANPLVQDTRLIVNEFEIAEVFFKYIFV